nr:CDP-glycerol glycerophosphotransferase family protein [Lachnospiraceae bacterium]
PMYISEALHQKRDDIKIVWLLDKNVKADLPDYVTRKDSGYFSAARELVSSKVWVDSNNKFKGVTKRKNQLYIQTWHGSYGIKKIGLDLAEKLPILDKSINLYNFRIADTVVTNSRRTTEIYKRAFLYNNNVLEVGSPRNDIFFGDDAKSISENVRKCFGIRNAKIVLFAPTFRSNFSLDFLDLDFEKLLNVLSEKDGCEWRVLVRLHPQNLNDAGNLTYSERIINASEYNVMQELLVASDILITDYSSCMFDFVTIPKPCFIYAPDLEEYENDRGNYFKMSELPFPLAKTNDELAENIKKFNEEEYIKKVKALHESVGLCETGHASVKAADYILEFIDKKTE